MTPDFAAFLHKSKNDIKELMEHGSEQNYGLMSKKMTNMYLECVNLLTIMNEDLDEMAREEKVVIDACGGMLEEDGNA